MQRDVVNVLRSKRWFVIRLRHTDPSGVPDLLAVKFGEAMFIEVKREKGGKVSKLQEVIHKKLRKQSMPVYVISNKQEILDLVRLKQQYFKLNYGLS